MMKHLFHKFFTALFASAVLVGSSGAETLYSHVFDGDATALGSVAPDTANTGEILGVDHGTSAANWSEAGVNQDGSIATSFDNAALPFVPKNGFIYILEFTGTVSGSGTNWLGAGFFNTPTATTGISFMPILFGYTRPGSSETVKQLASFDNYGRINASGSGRVGTSNNTASPSTITIVLDTTDGSGGWDAKYHVNGNLFATKTNMGTFAEAKILGVGFGGYPEADMHSFSLTVELPDLVLNSVTPQGAGIYPGANLVATFGEDIALTGSGSITLTDTNDGSDTRIITLPDAQVTTSGKNLVIDPTGNLDFGTNYQMTISPGAVERSAFTAPAFPGTTPGQWTFATAAQDFTAPVITARSPEDDTANASYNSNVVATFSDVILARSGNITIRNLADESDTRTIAVTDTSQITLSGSVLTIDPLYPLSPDSGYAVQIEPGAVSNFSDLPFGGISSVDATTWNFRTGSRHIVDVLVAYTPAVVSHHGTEDGVLAHIQALVASTNEAYERSGIIGEIRLAGTHLVNHQESGSDYQIDIDRLTGTSDGFMDEIHTLRNQTGADLVCLLRNNTVLGTAGLAWPLLSTDGGEPHRGFSVVTTQGALGGFTFAHELGHNMGLGHARDDNAGNGIFADSYGYRFNGTSGQQFRTIMAYSPGTRIAYFSTPDRIYDGAPVGVGPPSAPNSADGARTHSITMPVIAGYRSVSLNAADDIATTNIGNSLLIDVLSNDPSTGQKTAISILDVGSPDFGTAEVEAGQIRYTPPPGYTGTAAFTYTITDHSGGNGSATVSVTVQNLFSEWMANPEFGVPPGSRGLSDDPDGDGIPNAVEAWFGTHPGKGNGGIVNLTTDGTITAFQHPHNENPPGDLTGYYEWSPDLAGWYDANGMDGPLSGPSVNLSTVTVGPTTTVSATADEELDRFFLRVSVVKH